MTAEEMMRDSGLTTEDVIRLTKRETYVRSKYDNSHLVASRNPDYQLGEGDAVLFLRPPHIDILCMVTNEIPKNERSLFPNQPYVPLYRGVRVGDGVAIYFYRNEVRLLARDGGIPTEEWLDKIMGVEESKAHTTRLCAILQAQKAVAYEIKKALNERY